MKKIVQECARRAGIDPMLFDGFDKRYLAVYLPPIHGGPDIKYQVERMTARREGRDQYAIHLGHRSFGVTHRQGRQFITCLEEEDIPYARHSLTSRWEHDRLEGIEDDPTSDPRAPFWSFLTYEEHGRWQCIAEPALVAEGTNTRFVDRPSDRGFETWGDTEDEAREAAVQEARKRDRG